MKKIFLFNITLFVAGLSYAQTSTENYIQTTNCLDADCIKKAETVQYFDYLGRPKQSVSVKSSPTEKDVVVHVEYDALGRQTKEYLPVPQSGTQNGEFYTSPLGNASAVYGAEKIYTEKILENSPLQRVLQQKQVGNAWTDKPITFAYDTNTVADHVKKYAPITSWNATEKLYSQELPAPSEYQAGQLVKNTVTDEDGITTIEFKDGSGQTVLIRKVVNSSQNVDTYYVYDDYKQLVFVIPPLAAASASVSGTVLDNLCYQYKYDSRNRLVEKKLPGKAWEYMVYDGVDKLILSQDANQRASFSWTIYKYDIFGRPIYTGIVMSNNTRIGMQNQIIGGAILEGRDNTPLTANGMPYYYTNMHWGLDTLLSVTYYDSYPQQYGFNPPFPSNILGEPVLTENPTADGKSTKGLPVLSLVKNIEDDSWTKTYTYYDRKGRVIGTHSINHLGGYTRVESKLDFAGLPLQIITKHKRLASDVERVINENFGYDHQNRVLVHNHQIDSSPTEVLAKNEYNELSELKNKKVGGPNPRTPLESIDYTYNIRGWLTKINDPANLNGKLFGYEIKYTNPVRGNYPGRFNGNIAEVDWKAATDGQLRRYNYSYDPLNRLVHAIYLKPDASVVQTSAYNEWVDYDINGNITRLDRYGNSDGNGPMQIDRLYYTYSGNRLSKVEDASQNSSGYPYVASPNTINYDDNGNMTSQMDKGISSIQYNYLNLPKKITQNSKVTDYVYRADGVKVKKVLDTKTTDYLDGFQYDNSVLKFFPTAEGYFNVETGKYVYNYTDHLGNVRLSYAKNGAGTEIIEENNYYPFGLKHEGYNTLLGNPAYNYKYNGKELQENGMYDYGARMYMPDLGRWGVMDAMSEKYRRHSPYNYAVNNPVMVIDPDGNDVVSVNGGMMATGGDAGFAYSAFVATRSTSTNFFTGSSFEGLMDDYRLNRNGKFELIKKTKDGFDRLFNWNNTEFIKLNTEFMKNLRQDTEYDSYLKQYKPVETTITFENSSVSVKQIKNYFYFLAANTEKEWGFNHLTKNGWFSDSSVTIINSNHQDGSVGMSAVFKYLNSGYNLLGSGHSHPFLIYDHPENRHLLKSRYDEMAYPSGFQKDGSVDFGYKTGDRSSYENLLNKYGGQIKANPWIYIGNPDNRPHVIYYDTTSFRRK
ncbi:DUF6443 domain-containing protein [Chryseobacterium culicis]|uniref:RHS repeat-associated core domain-containing protein n=1 Tax=Chryseobacterium culicis TaxID=680127 RepID=A0A1H6HVM5_CHRCI|nr:DUF6443 domain-containing protein [Chryseobacterium culicis]SEH39988.1 RHS repeat-associated core domain-containing protein [Chryseobacterium culicis]